VLGRFLEVSTLAPDIPASLAFYESLGFVQAVVGDARSHAYAVVTDGRLWLGLHGAGYETPTLTWTHAEVARQAEHLTALGIDLEFARLGPEELHEIGFSEPSGQRVAIVEARTFSPPSVRPERSALGYFEEFAVPTTDLEASSRFWETLGLVAFGPEGGPFPRATVAARDLSLGLYDLDLRSPVITFSDPAMHERMATLRARGHRLRERLPRGLDPGANALLEAPEGTQFLLTTAGHWLG